MLTSSVWIVCRPGSICALAGAQELQAAALNQAPQWAQQLLEVVSATYVPQYLLHCTIPAPRCADLPLIFSGSLALVWLQLHSDAKAPESWMID